MTSMLWLAVHHAEWLTNYAVDNEVLLKVGTLGDFTDRNPLRFGLVNLQVALYPLLHDRSTTNLAVTLVCGCLFILWFKDAVRASQRAPLLCLGTIAALTLLGIYRYYDAALLIIPVCWFLSQFKSDKSAVLGLAPSAAFLIPGGTLLQDLLQKRIRS
jgi:hypothetical protein